MTYYIMPGIANRPRPEKLRFVHEERVKAAVLMHFNKDFEFFWQKNRDREMCYPRQVFMYLLRRYTKLELKEIAAFIHKKDHSNVCYACQVIKDLMDIDPRVKNEIESIVENF
jgi:chromosomal replication initiator protein